MSRPGTGERPYAWTRPASGGAAQPPVQRTGSPSREASAAGAAVTRAEEASAGARLTGVPEAARLPGDPRALSLAELRALRQRVRGVEADLSYVRRLLQGRIDILGAELARRAGDREAGDGRSVDRRSGDRRSGDGRSVDRRSGDRESGDQQSSDRQSPDRQSPDRRSRDQQSSDHRSSDRQLSDHLSAILTDRATRHRSSARHVTVATPRSAAYRGLAREMLDELDEVGLSDLRARSDEELRVARGRLGRYEQEVSGRRQEVQRTADACGAEITRRYREGEAQVDDLLA